MSDKDDKKGRRSTLADDLDATEWDFQPGKDKKILLRPVGSVFSDLPWEIQPQYLGPAPAQETDAEADEKAGDAPENPDDESLDR